MLSGKQSTLIRDNSTELCIYDFEDNLAKNVEVSCSFSLHVDLCRVSFSICNSLSVLSLSQLLFCIS